MYEQIKNGKVLILGVLFGCVCFSCITEVPIQTNAQAIAEAGNTLIVEGHLTDQIQTQKIVLSRPADFTNDSIVAFDLEDPGTYLFAVPELQERPILYETGAMVRILDDAGSEFEFLEGTPGNYFSLTPFGAQVNRGYHLEIKLRDGSLIRSEEVYLNGNNALTNLVAKLVIDPELGEGIGFFVSSQSQADISPYLRFTYEETFKVVAPLWNPQDFVLSNYNPCEDPVTYTLELVNREQQEQICFRTQESASVLLGNTKGLNDGILNDYRVHFISKSDFKIAHRYSISVRQQTVSLETYLFFENLKNFSQQDQIFSQIQPGTIGGNLTSAMEASVVPIGFFYVAAQEENRIFINFSDYFPEVPEPPYIVPCGLRSSPESHASRCPEFPVQGGTPLCPLSVIELLNLGDVITYAGPYQDEIIAICPGPHAYVPRICGDCTVLGENVPPAFWIEE
ncbi:MAG: hypothetical protein RLZZ241_1840 [Bacteroidota bacterium]|jgi:hypothetical protein